MSSDRECSLIIQAATRGLIDLSKANIHDRKWWRYLGWVIRQLEIDNLNRLAELRLQQHAAVVRYGLPEEVFNTHWSSINTLIQDNVQRYFPWIPATDVGPDNTAAKTLRDSWVATWGDPDSPETQEKIARTVEHLQRSRTDKAEAKPVKRPRLSRLGKE